MKAEVQQLDAAVQKGQASRISWERVIALGFCAAFWAVVGYFIFR
jgi:hypothetical protein